MESRSDKLEVDVTNTEGSGVSASVWLDRVHRELRTVLIPNRFMDGLQASTVGRAMFLNPAPEGCNALFPATPTVHTGLVALL